MADVFQDGDREACAREAAAAIEAVLHRRCPEMRSVFWSAVAQLYGPNAEPGIRPPTPPETGLRQSPPVEAR